MVKLIVDLRNSLHDIFVGCQFFLQKKLAIGLRYVRYIKQSVEIRLRCYI